MLHLNFLAIFKTGKLVETVSIRPDTPNSHPKLPIKPNKRVRGLIGTPVMQMTFISQLNRKEMSNNNFSRIDRYKPKQSQSIKGMKK